MQNIKYFKLQKILWFIPILNFFNAVIWVINMFSLRKKVNPILQAAVLFACFVIGYISWRLLSIACAVCMEYIDSNVVDSILKYLYYYLTGILLTLVFIVSEKKIVQYVNE